jgi:hypothetical protein
LITIINFAPTILLEHKQLHQFIAKIRHINHPNLLNMIGDAVLLEEINSIALRTDAPDHISAWK